MKKEKDPDREKLIQYCREVNAYVKPYGHDLLWNVKEHKAIGTCDCGQKVEVGLNNKEELMHIGQPTKCRIIR